MEAINGGQCSNEDLLRQIVRDQASADGRYRPAHGPGIVMHGNVVELRADAAHFIVSSVPSIQISINMESSGIVATTFLSPRRIAPSTRPRFVALVNEMNGRNRVPGRFAVLDRDMFYEAVIPAAFLPSLRNNQAARDEALKILFRNGVGIFESIAIAIEGLAQKDWSAHDALRFVDELYTRGFVYNDDWL